MPVNKERMTELCDALESGAYQQAHGKLRVDNSFCCLGVACEMSGLGEWEINHNGDYAYVTREGGDSFRNETDLPQAVKEYYGFAGRTGKSTRNIEMGEMLGSRVELVDLNDIRGWPLPKIGAFLRKHMDDF